MFYVINFITLKKSLRDTFDMNKVIITTVLDPDVKQKLSEFSKSTYIPYSKIIEYAVNDFNSALSKGSYYQLKHNDFDRLKTQSFTCSIMEDINTKLIKFAEQLDISKRMLIREIITSYVNSKI